MLDWIAQVFVTSYGETQPALMRVLRLTRVLRTLRVVRVARGLHMLLSMLFVSGLGLLNLVGLYLVINVVYALLAMQLFGRLVRGEFVTSQANFCDFPTSLLTLFRRKRSH